MMQKRQRAGGVLAQGLIFGRSLDEEIRWFMFLRILLVGLLLGFTILNQLDRVDVVSAFQTVFPLYALLTLSFGVNLIFSLLLPRVQNWTFFSISQIVFDLLFITALLFVTEVTGGVFNFLYLLIILFASFLFARRGALYTALGACACYTFLLLVHPEDQDFFYHAFVNSTAFLVVGLLSGYLVSELRLTGYRLKEKQRDVARLEMLNKAILDNIETGIVTIDMRGKLTYLNPAAEKLTGVSFAQVKGIHLQSLFPEFQDVVKRYGELKEEGKRLIERNFTTPDGKTLRFGFAVSTLKSEDATYTGKIVIFEDLTKVIEMERKLVLSDKLAAVAQLAAGIAHEIRNPLASMSGSIEMLRPKFKPHSDEERLMNIIVRESDRLNTLLTEFLEFVKPTKTKELIFSLRESIEETITTLKMNKEITREVTFEISPTLAPGYEFSGDPDKIKQIFWNLFLNACQAMPYGGIVKISALKKDHTITISVYDSGEGIEEENLGKIFDPFYTTKERGTGLGLSTTYKIVEAYQGSIRVESERGKGSTFFVTLPLSQEKEEGIQYATKDFSR